MEIVLEVVGVRKRSCVHNFVAEKCPAEHLIRILVHTIKERRRCSVKWPLLYWRKLQRDQQVGCCLFHPLLKRTGASIGRERTLMQCWYSSQESAVLVTTIAPLLLHLHQTESTKHAIVANSGFRYHISSNRNGRRPRMWQDSLGRSLGIEGMSGFIAVNQWHSLALTGRRRSSRYPRKLAIRG